mmetsp:Transcript_41924/g.88005  ORF Transcript_41924/g.88005 Transcript_41924/m.88005 type:complete len:263 (-) Transcript_41924:146-934(-)
MSSILLGTSGKGGIALGWGACHRPPVADAVLLEELPPPPAVGSVTEVPTSPALCGRSVKENETDLSLLAFILISCFPFPLFGGGDAFVESLLLLPPAEFGRLGKIVFPPGAFFGGIAVFVDPLLCTLLFPSLFPNNSDANALLVLVLLVVALPFFAAASSPSNFIENQLGPNKKAASPSHPPSCASFNRFRSRKDSSSSSSAEEEVLMERSGGDPDNDEANCVAAGAVQSSTALRASYAFEWADERPEDSTLADIVVPTVSI